MRRFALLLLIAASTVPVFAAKRVTVEQLQQTLTAAHGKSDTVVATQLSDLQLNERLSTTQLSSLAESLPGPQSKQALIALADLSAFLPPPASDLPAKAAPDVAEQRRLMALTVTYVSQTLHQLPNFSATRVTTRFEDQPQGFARGGKEFSPPRPLAMADKANATVHYRDGAEVVNAVAIKGRQARPANGMTTSGEFGPILATTLLDAAHSKLAWSHWEQDEASSVAVFRYAVPREKSHYEVSYCCFVRDGEFFPFRQISGYHGEIAVDPANGTVIRVTAEADLKPGDPLVRADISVEYGRVELGGKFYLCPVKSISVSQVQAADANMPESRVQFSPGYVQTLVNDVAFVDYHLFRAETRLLAVDSPESEQAPSAAPSTMNADASPAPSANPAPIEEPAASMTAATPPQQPEKSIGVTASMVAPEPAVTSNAPANAEPDFNAPANTQTQTGAVPIFKANSQAVVVDVVVTKSSDEPIRNLHKEDFILTEDGASQPVDLFEEHTSETPPPTSPTKMPPNVFTNEPAAPPNDSVNVLLIDSLNTDREDQVYVHQQILAFLKTMDPGTRMAIFTLSSKLRMVQGFSTDSSALIAALNDPKYGAQTERTAMSRSTQDKLADQDEVATLSAEQMSGMGLEALQASQASFATFQTDKRVGMTLEAMNYIARYLAGVPGRKNLIWFSSSFPISIFPDEKQKELPEAMRQYGAALKQTADLLTLSKIAVYPVGAEGVVGEHLLEASTYTPTNTEGASTDNRMGGSTSQRQGDPMVPYIAEHAARGAKITSMEQIAAETGGEAIYNTNDLKKALARVVQNGSHYYTLVYTPSNKTLDGKYRRIIVKVRDSKYKLAYRRGYYADAAPEGEPAPTTDPLRPMLARGLPSATQLLYGIRVLPTATQPAANAPREGGNPDLTGPVTRYTADFMIRWTDIDLQATPQGNQAGKIQVGLIAYDRAGKPVNWVGASQAMSLNASTFAAIQKSGIPAHLEFDLPQGQFFLKTGIYDWASRRAGTLEIPISNPPATGSLIPPTASAGSGTVQ